MSPGRRGVSLVELLVALALLALLATAALRATVVLGRQAVAVAEHATLQAGVRTGALLARAELREVGRDETGTDLVRLGPDSVTFRAARGFGVTCGVSASQLRVRDAPPVPFSRLRAVAPGRDSLLLFVDGDSTSPADDRWIVLPVLAVGSSSCGGSPAIAVQTSDLAAALPTGSLAEIVVGGPVRTFEVVRLGEYASGGQRWLGLASVSGGESIQPVAGPLSGEGLTLEYLDAAGAPVADPAEVVRIRVTLVGASERPIPAGWTGSPRAIAAETASTQVFLRNVQR